MNRNWTGILLASAVLLAGCAARQAPYAKPGATAADQQRDVGECVQNSLGHFERTHILLPYAIDRDAFRSCMEARSYRFVQL